MRQGSEAGFPLRYNPSFSNERYMIFDQQFRETCCERGVEMCDIFYQQRPPDRCDSYSPPVNGKFFTFVSRVHNINKQKQLW